MVRLFKIIIHESVPAMPGETEKEITALQEEYPHAASLESKQELMNAAEPNSTEAGKSPEISSSSKQFMCEIAGCGESFISQRGRTQHRNFKHRDLLADNFWADLVHSPDKANSRSGLHDVSNAHSESPQTEKSTSESLCGKMAKHGGKSSDAPRVKKPRNKYDNEFKMQVIKFEEKNRGILLDGDVAERFGIANSMLSRWRQNRDKIQRALSLQGRNGSSDVLDLSSESHSGNGSDFGNETNTSEIPNSTVECGAFSAIKRGRLRKPENVDGFQTEVEKKFHCEFPGCDEWFLSRRGRTQHWSYKHRELPLNVRPDLLALYRELDSADFSKEDAPREQHSSADLKHDSASNRIDEASVTDCLSSNSGNSRIPDISDDSRMQEPQITEKVKKHRNSYSIEFKLNVLKFEKTNRGKMSDANICAKFGIDRSMLVRWKQNELKISEAMGIERRRKQKKLRYARMSSPSRDDEKSQFIPGEDSWREQIATT